MITINCTKKERNLIRQVIDIQLKNLEAIVQGVCPMELDEFCEEYEIDRDAITTYAIQNMERFQKVKNDPTKLFFLDDDNLSIFRHILFNLKTKKPSKIKAKKMIWRKIFKVEKTLKFYNPN